MRTVNTDGHIRKTNLLPAQPFYKLLALLVFSSILCGCQLIGKPGPQEPEYVKNPCLVLALPTSGPYASISSKIKKGAETARKQLKTRGVDIRLENINTDSPDWLQRLSALPPMCAVVGGPMRDKSYIEARKAGITNQRVFFAFLPNLQSGDEGASAWRFFPSPEDQINTLIKFATDEMNMRTYGALSPNDNYGKKMTGFLENSLKKRNIPLQKSVYANPSAPAVSSALKPLINPKIAEDGKTILPQTTFEAIFLPDSWKRVDMITSGLKANGEDRLLLLGTTLWEQGLTGKQIPEAERYALAIYPGAWDKNRAPGALKQAGNDFWTALGYDFINFGSAVALAVRPESRLVNDRIQKASGSIKAMAPIFWDNNGHARQQLYLFQISPSGPTPANASQLRQKRNAIAEKTALRLQGWSHIDPDTGEAISDAPQNLLPDDEPGAQEDVETSQSRPISTSEPDAVAPSLPATQPAVAPAAAPAQSAQPASDGAVFSSVPRPSYKLSLPKK